MGLIAKYEGGSDYQPIKAGVYQARCIGLVDLGNQENTAYGVKQHKILIIWDFPQEIYEKDGEIHTRQISKEFTVSLHEKANLRKTLDSWRGRAFTEEELQGFHLNKILNVGCQLQVINVEKNGKKYSNIQTVMALPKGTVVEKRKDLILFDLDEEAPLEKMQALPEWIQNKIKESEEYKKLVKNNGSIPSQESKETDEDFEDEFPF